MVQSQKTIFKDIYDFCFSASSVDISLGGHGSQVKEDTQKNVFFSGRTNKVEVPTPRP